MTSLGEKFRTFRRSAWRLEVRDSYDVDTEQGEVAEWLRTGYIEPHPAWDDIIAAAHRRGATIGRVRLVGRPITDYTRFELAAFRQFNLPSGEDIQVVDRAWLDRSWDQAPDVWIFDDAEVWVLTYTRDGKFAGAAPVAYPAPYLDLRARIVPHAVPLTDFHLAEIPTPRAATTTPAPLPQGITQAG